MESKRIITENLDRGMKIYAISRSRSKSGASEDISFVGIMPDGGMLNITPNIAEVCGYNVHSVGWRGLDSIRVLNVVGSDRASHIINKLSNILYGNEKHILFWGWL